MKIKKLAVMAAMATVAFSAVQAQAQSAAFQGFSVGLNAGVNAADTELTYGGAVIDGVGHTSAVGTLQGAYGWAMGPQSVVSVGATYNLNDADGAEFRNAGGLKVLDYKARDVYSIYVEPGFLLSDKTLAFLSLSYEGATAKGEGSGYQVRKGIRGAGYGFGMRTALDKNLYFQVAVKHVVYDSERFPNDPTDFKAKSTLGSVGVGYKF